ncbi:MAG: long-chain fatty aldehyde decarbonylase [FCB group bacterium]|nr:long-chain fatty aldehyde decarbonylase [FCB group bacterium]
MPKAVTAYSSCEALLIDAIRDEQTAAQWYADAADITPDPEIRSLLKQLAEMENNHARDLTLCLESIRNQQAVQQGILASFGETGLVSRRETRTRGILHD